MDDQQVADEVEQAMAGNIKCFSCNGWYKAGQWWTNQSSRYRICGRCWMNMSDTERRESMNRVKYSKL